MPSSPLAVSPVPLPPARLFKRAYDALMTGCETPGGQPPPVSAEPLGAEADASGRSGDRAGGPLRPWLERQLLQLAARLGEAISYLVFADEGDEIAGLPCPGRALAQRADQVQAQRSNHAAAAVKSPPTAGTPGGGEQPTVITVEISETITYRKDYSRCKLAALLARGGYDRAELAALTDAALAQLIEQERPACVEDDMQRDGDVGGASWAVHATLSRDRA